MNLSVKMPESKQILVQPWEPAPIWEPVNRHKKAKMVPNEVPSASQKTITEAA